MDKQRRLESPVSNSIMLDTMQTTHSKCEIIEEKVEALGALVQTSLNEFRLAHPSITKFKIKI